MTTETPVHLLLSATGGTGSALARRLAARGGCQLALAGRSADATEALAREVGGTAHIWSEATFDETERVVADVLSRHGRLDGLVCCSGSLILKPAHRTSEEEWRETCAANLDAAFAAVRAGAGAMQKSKGGSIVLMASAAARIGFANHEAIAAAKAGVIGLGLSAAATYAPRGVRVNVVAPGLVDTPLAEPITSREAALDASAKMHAMGRIGRPEEVASAIEWLLSPEQGWVTGQVLGVDGGLGSLRGR